MRSSQGLAADIVAVIDRSKPIAGALLAAGGSLSEQYFSRWLAERRPGSEPGATVADFLPGTRESGSDRDELIG